MKLLDLPRDERGRRKLRRPTMCFGMRFRENQSSQWLTDRADIDWCNMSMGKVRKSRKNDAILIKLLWLQRFVTVVRYYLKILFIYEG